MSDAIDNAAAAFQNSMSSNPTSLSRAAPMAETTGAIERISADDYSEDSQGYADESDDARGDGSVEARARSDAPERKSEKKVEQFGDLDDDDPYGDMDEGEEGPDKGEGDDEGDEGQEGEEGKAAQPSDLNMDAVVKMKIDGEEVSVSLRDALASGIRERTFYNRLNEVNEQKGIAEQVYTAGLNAVKIYKAKIEQMEQELEALQGLSNEPDWVEEYQRDPQAAAMKQKTWNEFKKSRDALKAEKERAQQELVQHEGAQFRRHVQNETRKMLLAVPEWNNPERLARARKAMTSVAKSVGFSDDEINSVSDHRMMLILDKAARYDAITRVRKPKGEIVTRKTGKGGAVNGRAAPNSSDRAQTRLRRTGSIDEAAEVMKRFL